MCLRSWKCWEETNLIFLGGDIFMFLINSPDLYFLPESLWNYWQPLPTRTRKMHSSTSNSIILRCLLSRFDPYLDRFEPFWTKTGRREEIKRLKGNSTLSLLCTIINFPSESKLPFPACFLSILRTEENSGWIDDQVKVGEEKVESR